jgi:hypothetical protein
MACAATLGLITACSSGTVGGATPLAVIRLAAADSQNVTSLVADVSIQGAGSTSSNVNGKVQVQLKPSLVIAETLEVPAGGQLTSFNEILTSKAVYTNLPGLVTQPGKFWAEIPFSGLSGPLGDLGQLLQNATSTNPLTQVRALAGAAGVRRIGTQVINGVSTTHYSGKVKPTAALPAVPSSLRKELRSSMSTIKGDISWNIWLDAQHHVRELVETETVSGTPITVTMGVISIDQPITISVPPPELVSVVPATALSVGGQ